MIVEPKPYYDNINGGYLLNDEEYSEDILIDKAGYKQNSEIGCNIIFDMVNNLSRTPFKINLEVLNFLENYGEEYGLLITDSFDKEFLGLENKTKYQKEKYFSITSKYKLQENVLEIARIFSKRTIYFPIRLDQRGRVYCGPSYFNYQASDIAKCLLLFVKPGIINREDKEQSAKFLKVFGANCFGNGLDKQCFKKRVL